MNKILFKFIAVMMSLVMLIASVPFVSARESDKNIALIYIVGQGTPIEAVNEDGSTRDIYPINLPDDFIETTVKENFDCFAKAFVTQNWDEFCDVLYNIISSLYGELKLDENAKPIVNSRVKWTWNKSNPHQQRTNNSYGIREYEFCYDWRLDPYECADSLHEYIEDIIAATGVDSVALAGRCLGSCVAAAYMDKYDCQHVSDLILYASALKGATQVTKAFCGELHLDADGVERFLYDLEISTDENINQLLRAFISIYNNIYGLDLTCWSFNNVYEKIYLQIVPRILIDTFGTFPGIWSMVNDTDYNKAKETVFYGCDLNQYSDFIDIIDNYHYNVQVKAEKNLKEYSKNGIEIANVSKYGYQSLPITQDADILSDDICDVYSASMGAATANVNTSFSNKYCRQAVRNGTMKYISPDRQIDASTCLFPDRTWFIKNLDHKNFPEIIYNLFYEIIYNDSYTVFTDNNYPQYLVYNNTDGAETFLPMSDENKDTHDKYKVSFFEAVVKFFKSLYKIIISKLAEGA